MYNVCVQVSLFNLITISIQIFMGSEERMMREGREMGVSNISDLKMAKLQFLLFSVLCLYPEQSTDYPK